MSSASDSMNKIYCCILLRKLFFRDSALKPPEKMLRVTFDDELTISRHSVLTRPNCVYKQICQVRLDARMQMDFRLLEYYNRAAWHIKSFDNYRQHLAHTESDIRELYLGLFATCFDQNLIFLSMLS